MFHRVLLSKLTPFVGLPTLSRKFCHAYDSTTSSTFHLHPHLHLGCSVLQYNRSKMPLHQVFTYVIAAIMAMFAAHQVLESNGIIFMPTLPAFNPFTEELFPIFYKQESEPSPSTPTFESTPFTATESIMIAPTVSSPIPSISSSKTASETIQVDPTTPRGERLTDDTLPMQHTMTSDTLDDSNYLENDEDATDGCSTVCQFFLKHRKLFIVYAVLSLKWDSYLQHHLENIIDFRTHRVMAIGAVFGTFFALIILIRAMTTSSGTLPRVVCICVKLGCMRWVLMYKRSPSMSPSCTIPQATCTQKCKSRPTRLIYN